MTQTATPREPTYTVFMPTYNRAHTIFRVYESLKVQTYRDFEWLIIDDGSTDHTSSLVEAWLKEALFPITYIQQPNSGKHRAFNRAVSIARGTLFLPIDSDDGFLPDALEKMLAYWNDIPPERRNEFTGIVTLCQLPNGTICGRPFPRQVMDTNALALRYKHKRNAATWGFHRTEVLRCFPFPEDPTVRYVPENIVWDAIARRYSVRCVNEPLKIYYQDSGNQLTKADVKNAARVYKYFFQILNRDLDYFRFDPGPFLRKAVLYVRYSLHCNDLSFLDPRTYPNRWAYALCLVCLGPGLSMYLVDRLKKRS